MHFLRKITIITIVMLMTATYSVANKTNVSDGPSAVQIKHNKVEHSPKDSSILASINGHTLTVTFLENLGNVQIDITTASGGAVSYGHVWTPDSYIAYITNTGSYVVTITLENGDEYYGEFEVTD